jgi:hypothetical protein
MAAARKKEKKAKNMAQVAGTHQTLSNLFFFLLISMTKAATIIKDLLTL